MSKIGQVIMGVQERTGKEVEEITNEDFIEEAFGVSFNTLNLGHLIHSLDSDINQLNAFRGDLSPVKEDLDLIIAKLIKVAEKAGKKWQK